MLQVAFLTKTSTLVATVMTVVKYSPEAWVLQKVEEDALEGFERNFIEAALGRLLVSITLFQRISCTKKYGLIQFLGLK